MTAKIVKKSITRKEIGKKVTNEAHFLCFSKIMSIFVQSNRRRSQ